MINKKNKSFRIEADQVDYDPFAEPEPEAAVPATYMQLDIWLSAQMGDEASCAFNESCTLRFIGPLDRSALHGAIQDVVQRHQALRATFSANGKKMCIAKTVAIDLPESQFPEEVEFDDALTEAIAHEVSMPFNLEHGPLFRANLLQRNKEEHYLFLSAHHIICDGWSLEVILNDLSSYYTARHHGQSCVLDRALQYGDYAISSWSEAAIEKQCKVQRYWLNLLSGELPMLDLPLDKARLSRRSFSSARVEHRLPPQLVDKLKHFGAERRASFFTVLLAGFQVLLHRISAQTDIITGVPMMDQSAACLTNLVGHCVNLLPIRSSINGSDTFLKHFEQVRYRMLDAHDNQECSFGRLLPELNIPRQANRIPLMSVLFGYYKTVKDGAQNFTGLQTNHFVNARTSENFEIYCSTMEEQGEVTFKVQYNTDLFEAETIARWMKTFEVLLSSVAENADRPIAELPLLDETEWQLLRGWNETRMPYRRDVCLHQLLAERAAEIPELEAAQDESCVLSYSELNTISDRFAAYLVTEGVKVGDIIGICMRRSVDMLIGLLGIIKSGAAYLPLDPVLPRDRLKFMIEDAAVQRIVTEKQFEEEFLGELLPSSVLICYDQMSDVFQQQDCSILKGVKTDPEQNVYIMYTSGSTGKPKGVQVPHRAVINFLTSMAEQPGMTDEDVLLAVTTLSFDIAVLELYLPLLVGAKTVIANQETATDGKRLLEAIERHEITMMQATPATWRLILGENWNDDRKIKVLCGGEPFPRDLLKGLLMRASSVWNMYGPTETTVWSTCCQIVDAEAAIHIGKPIGNTQTYVLTESMQRAPIGVVGELYIGGDGVTHGYLNRPALTADRFVKNPFRDNGSGLLYGTGDLARMLSDGSIECLGRIDNQIKLRGFRIELGEIEAVLGQHPAVRETAVVAREDHLGDKRLVAYVTFHQGLIISAKELRNILKGKLPNYMIPSAFVVMDSLPLTPNGKVDRKSLTAPERGQRDPEDSFVAPGTPVEKALTGVWCEVLGLKQLGIHDNFFDLGGHSLLATQVISRARLTFDVDVPLRCLFESPTVAGLAAALLQRTNETQKLERRAELLLTIAELSEEEVNAMLDERSCQRDSRAHE